MVVIVRQHAGRVREVHRERQHPWREAWAQILRERSGRHEPEDPEKRTTIGGITKTHFRFSVVT